MIDLAHSSIKVLDKPSVRKFKESFEIFFFEQWNQRQCLEEGKLHFSPFP